jgi:S1-C subfamily serine protease
LNFEEQPMNTIRKTLLAAIAAGALPGWSAAGEPPRPAPAPRPPQAGQPLQQADMQRQLEEARRRLEMASAEVARLSSEMGRNVGGYYVEGARQPRALLGVALDPDEKKDGARVQSVSPGGAAEEAGIKVGDIITSIGGQDLGKEEHPNRALTDRMAQIEPNLKLQVGVLREGRKLNLDVVPRPSPTLAQELSRLYSEVRIRQPQAGRGFTTIVPGEALVAGTATNGERRVEIRNFPDGPNQGERFRDMEFATLSEKLGGYFGVKSGVLVVRAGANSAFKLEDGDVLLAIDGREATSAQQAGRILRSYGDGEKLKLRIQRDRKAQDIEITMPGPGGEVRGPAPAPARRN